MDQWEGVCLHQVNTQADKLLDHNLFSGDAGLRGSGSC